MYSLYKGAFEDVSTRDITLAQLVKIIKQAASVKALTQQYRELLQSNKFAAKQLKNSMLGVISGGQFKAGKKIEHIAKPSGLMIMDYDDSYDPEVISQLRDKVIALPETRLCFISPSGGLKWAIQTDFITANNKHHNLAYMVLVEHYETTLQIKLDPACKNINRLTYIAHDPDCYLNTESDVVALTSEVKQVITELEIAEKKAITKAEKDRLEREVRGLVICEKRQEAFKQAAIKKYYQNDNIKGQRHVGVFKLGMQLYQLGYSKLKVELVYNSLKSTNAYTEELSPKDKAVDVYNNWLSVGRPMNQKIFKTQTEAWL